MRLPTKAIEELEHEIRRPGESRYQNRVRAVHLLAKGKTYLFVVEAAEVSPRTLARWMRRYLKHGLVGLRDSKRPGRPPGLTPAQLALLKAMVCRPPKDFGLRGETWTAPLLAAWAERSFGIHLAARTWRGLRRGIRIRDIGQHVRDVARRVLLDELQRLAGRRRYLWFPVQRVQKEWRQIDFSRVK